MQLAPIAPSTTPDRPFDVVVDHLPLIAKHELHHHLDRGVYLTPLNVARPGGYSTARGAIEALTKITAGEAGAAAVVHRGGRFFGQQIGEARDWATRLGRDWNSEYAWEVMPMGVDEHTTFLWRNTAVVAVVDGDVVLRNA